MGELAELLAGSRDSRQLADEGTRTLMRRVVESLSTMHPGRYTVYLGRPDPVAVRSDWEQEAALIRSARRAVVATPATTPLPQEADRRDPGLGWLSETWFSAVVGDNTAMALVCRPDFEHPDEAWLLTEPDSVRRLIRSVEGELARPDPQLLAV